MLTRMLISREFFSGKREFYQVLEATSEGAVFSASREHRYLLWRVWSGTDRLALFVGLNPSTADETADDPTIRRCIGFARRWNCSGVLVANLFAFRATEPKILFRAEDPIGADNDDWISLVSRKAERTVVCWGNHGKQLGRSNIVLRMLHDPICFYRTKAGEPVHPLYLPYTSTTTPALSASIASSEPQV